MENSDPKPGEKNTETVEQTGDTKTTTKTHEEPGKPAVKETEKTVEKKN